MKKLKKMVTNFPCLMEEWHPTKNSNLSPCDVSYGSDKRIWWICKKGHEWITSVSQRTSGCNCPYCSNKKVCIDNCLATNYPKIAEQWNLAKNNGKTPFDVVAGSAFKVWWICEKGHEWKTTCCSRLNTGCPYCKNKKICRDNNFAFIFPDLMKEWHLTKNILTPYDVTPFTNKKIWWVCEKGHEWQTTCRSRARLKTGCPYCVNQKTCMDNCFATKNLAFYLLNCIF